MPPLLAVLFHRSLFSYDEQPCFRPSSASASFIADGVQSPCFLSVYCWCCTYVSALFPSSMNIFCYHANAFNFLGKRTAASAIQQVHTRHPFYICATQWLIYFVRKRTPALARASASLDQPNKKESMENALEKERLSVAT